MSSSRGRLGRSAANRRETSNSKLPSGAGVARSVSSGGSVNRARPLTLSFVSLHSPARRPLTLPRSRIGRGAALGALGASTSRGVRAPAASSVLAGAPVPLARGASAVVRSREVVNGPSSESLHHARVASAASAAAPQVHESSADHPPAAFVPAEPDSAAPVAPVADARGDEAPDDEVPDDELNGAEGARAARASTLARIALRPRPAK